MQYCRISLGRSLPDPSVFFFAVFLVDFAPGSAGELTQRPFQLFVMLFPSLFPSKFALVVGLRRGDVCPGISDAAARSLSTSSF